jgi:hypothetical protein
MNKRTLVLILSTLGIIILVVAILEITNTTHLFHKSTGISVSAGPNTKGENSSTNSSSSNPGAENQKSTTSPGSTILLAPTGNFVSNHHPNLSGSPAPNTISSVCYTTPGATCVIRFSNDNTTKTLSSQTTDQNGYTYWNWKLQDQGLSAGTWSVEAIATLNGQEKTAKDPLNMSVAP